MILSFVYPDPVCGEVDTRPWVVANVHYMYFAMFSFFSTALVMSIVSLLSAPPTEAQISGLTFWTRNDGLISAKTKETTGDNEDDLSVIRELRLGEEIVLSPMGDEESVNGVQEDETSEKNKLPMSKSFLHLT